MTVFRPHCIRLMIHLRAGYVCVTQCQEYSGTKSHEGEVIVKEQEIYAVTSAERLKNLYKKFFLLYKF